MSEAEASLKCVIAWSDKRNLCSLVLQALEARVRTDEVRRLGEESLVLFSEAEPAEVRDWAAEVLEAGESVLVVEFERWSSHGTRMDTAWLMRRGH